MRVGDPMLKRFLSVFSIRKSVQAKLFLLILLVATIPLLTLGYVLYNRSTAIVNDKFGRYGDNSVSQLQFQIDANLGQMKFAVGKILSYLIDPKFEVLHEEFPTTYKGFQDEQQFEQFLKAHKTVDMKGIFLITKSGYYYGETTINTNLLRQEAWYKEAMQRDEPFQYHLYEPVHYSGPSRIAGERVLGLLFRIRNQHGVLEDSAILIEIKAEKLLKLFREFEINTGSVLHIVDGSGQAIYQTANPSAPRSNDIVWEKKASETDWHIEVRTSYDRFYESSLLIRTFTFTTVSMCLLLAFLLAYYIAYRFLRQIKRLKESMHLVSLGNLEARIPIETEDEIGRLSHHFNSMLVQLKGLLAEVRRVEQTKKEAELRAIHHQINPHLLINTLASIQWKARLEGAPDISRMIHHLTMVLEGNLTLTKEIVTLRQELDVINHYLKVQELRYGPVFSYRIVNRDVQLEDVHIPRMTLQPLIENIFFHGFEDGKGNIELRIEEDDRHVTVTVSDNGKGISEETLKGLLQPHTESDSRGHIGMYNVHQKIKLHFGDRYGLSVQSISGSGTTISIKLPKRREQV